MVEVSFLSRYLSGPLPYVCNHITVNKMYSVHHKIKHFLPSFLHCVVAGYLFLEACQMLQGWPVCVSTDMGTENIKVAQMQQFLSEIVPQCYPCYLSGTGRKEGRKCFN